MERSGSTPHIWRGWHGVFRVATVLLPAVVVFGVEYLRHEVLHDVVPEMWGNVMTGAIAFSTAALILIPIYRRLEAADDQLHAAEVERAVSDERERLARELHDGISQALFFLGVKARALDSALDALDLETTRAAAREITQALEETSGRVRDAIFDLRTGPEPGQPFGAWVRGYVKRFGEIHGLVGAVDETGAETELPLAHALHAMAMTREALHNVAKHAGAKTIAVGLEWGVTHLTVAVVDDGRGVPDPIPGLAQGRYGLAALREHARATGGSVSVAPAGLGGTVVSFRLPYANGDHA